MIEQVFVRTVTARTRTTNSTVILPVSRTRYVNAFILPFLPSHVIFCPFLTLSPSICNRVLTTVVNISKAETAITTTRTNSTSKKHSNAAASKLTRRQWTTTCTRMVVTSTSKARTTTTTTKSKTTEWNSLLDPTAPMVERKSCLVCLWMRLVAILLPRASTRSWWVTVVFGAML